MSGNPSPNIPDSLWWLWEQLKALEPKTTLGGIYANKSGYHNTRKANQQKWPGNYSIVDPQDQGGPDDMASAIDWTFPEAQRADYDRIMLYSERLLASGRDMDDPRGNCLREFYGQADADTAVEGWDFRYLGPRTSDASHLWHIHISFSRDTVMDKASAEAVLSILRGETVAQWRNGSTSEEDDHMLTIVSQVDPETKAETFWLCDAIWSRRISKDDIRHYQHMAEQGAINLWRGGEVWENGYNPEIWGRPVDSPVEGGGPVVGIPSGATVSIAGTITTTGK